MSYNSGGKISARVGNWVEEQSLKALTGQSRGGGNAGSTSRKAQKPMSHTAMRVIAHSDAQDPADWASSNSGYKDPVRVQPKRQTGGKRAALREAKIRKQIEEELAREAKRAEAKANRGRYQTASQAAFVKPNGFGKIGSRVMKTQTGSAPRNQDEQTYEFGMHARKPTMSDAALKGELGESYYLNDMPISVYTQRMNDGSMPGTGVGNSGNPFAKSAAFTNDIMDSSKRHAEGMDDASGEVAGAGTVLTRVAGGGLSVRGVIQRVLACIVKATGANGIRGLKKIFDDFDDDGTKTLSREELRTGLMEYGCRLSVTDLDQIYAHFDHDRSGTISYAEFIRGVRGSMNAGRKALVNAAFDMLEACGRGYVNLAAFQEGYDWHNDPLVMTGQASKDEAVAEMFSHFQLERGMVTRESFVQYYTDISAGIQRDEMFETMMRTAWQVTSGGPQEKEPFVVGVTLKSGKREELAIKFAVGLGPQDWDKMRARLHKQGVHGVVKLEHKGKTKSFD